MGAEPVGALFGAIAALSIGLSDLFNRRVAIEASVPTVALSLQVFALVTALTSLTVVDSVFAWRDLLIGGASGVAMAGALGAYFAGVTRSTATVVAPIVGVLSSVLPFVYALTTGASAGPLAVIGALAALVGLALISLRGVSARGGAVETSRGGKPRVENAGVGVLFGTLSGTGFGLALILVLNAADAAGTWPAVGERTVAASLTFIAARLRGASIVPPAGLRLTAVIGGLLAGGGTVFFIVAKAFDPVKAVVATSTYPAVIVLVGYLAFGDQVTRRQLFGLMCVLAGVAAVSVG